MATAGALEDQELMPEGKNLSFERCSSLKGLPRRRKQRENDREHVAEKLQRRPPKFNQFSQNGVFGRDRWTPEEADSFSIGVRHLRGSAPCDAHLRAAPGRRYGQFCECS